ncbi:hypothetical protein CA850_06345, partial [Micromonospora echinospora]
GGGGGGGGQQPLIVVDSLDEARARVSGVDEVRTDEYEVTFLIRGGSGGVRSATFVLLPENAGELHILGPLAELSVRGSGTVVVPGQPQGTVLGPELFIRAANVRVDGPALEFARRPDGRVSGGSAEPSVVIEATSSLQLPHAASQLPVDGELEFRVPSTIKLSYPWVAFRAELVEDENPDQKVIRFLNKLMNLTRSHGHTGERGVYIKKFEGRQPFLPAEFNKAIQVLVEENVVRRDGYMVFLRDEWEAHRYSGKALKGQRQLHEVWNIWAPVAKLIEQRIAG